MGYYFISPFFEFMAEEMLKQTKLTPTKTSSSVSHKKPSKVLSDASAQVLNVSVDTEEETVSESMDQDNADWEAHIRQVTEEWLDLHGSKLFALEASKFLTKEKRRKDIRSIR